MAPTAIWVAAEEAALVDFLLEHKAEAGDGANFKGATFQKALVHIAPLHKRGAGKTVKMIQNKWGAFRTIFKIIQKIKLVSGWTWDDTTGASITPDTASSWDAYVRAHKEAKPFRNKGWVHLHKVEQIMPSTVPGAHIFHPTGASQATISTSQSTSVDSDDPDAPDVDIKSVDESPSDAEEVSKPVISKHREPATPTPTASKHVRANGASALLQISESLNSFNSAIATALAPPSSAIESSPMRFNRALTGVQQREKAWLDKTQLVCFIDFLRSDKGAIDTYLSLTEEDIRKEWVRIQLENLGVVVYPEYA